MDKKTLKSSFRKELISKRNNIQPYLKNVGSNKIFDEFKDILLAKDYSSYNFLSYFSMKNVVNTYDINKFLLESYNLYLPKTSVGDFSMEFYRIDGSTVFDKSSFGVWEPIGSSPIDIKGKKLFVIVPMLAYYEKYRIGYGGGFYDRFLYKAKLFSASLFSLGIAFNEMKDSRVMEYIEAHDIALDMIITG